ncbi:hypothetical protein AZE42_06133 [Rhizopogon vesiculosus]|uniref:Uncharacterized protein n=1 Tax=Rhizopogon vesiculosus TaxID=180088 RepID=A0A1J8QEZ7_9AGAM|nr:hypothetical protein AZE42_06133 [Rhizopogon vesiculosus]
MATVKLATLVIRTLAKPISTQLKNQAKQHETFRSICISLAQSMHTAEVKLRTNILGETWRTSRNQSKRRDDVDDRIEELSTNVASLTERLERIQESLGDLDGERARNNELARIVERIVEIGLRGGWAEFEDTPLKIPRVELVQTSSKP